LDINPTVIVEVTMSLKEQLEKSLLDAMRSNDTNRKNVIRLVLTGAKLTEVEKGSKLDDAGLIAIIQKEVKQHQETIEGVKKANRQDLIDIAQSEVAILESFLPKQMSQDELLTIVKEVIQSSGAKDMKDMGKVMKEVLPKVVGKSSNELVSKTVRELLSQPE
jgi:uncharacterized protein YqeY